MTTLYATFIEFSRFYNFTLTPQSNDIRFERYYCFQPPVHYGSFAIAGTVEWSCHLFLNSLFIFGDNDGA